MDARQSILLDYEGLQDGTTRAGELCPACSGGATKERTLSVTREGGVLKWYCHRASCGFKGTSYGNYSATRLPEREAKLRGDQGRYLLHRASRVPETIQEVLKTRYCITDEHIARFQLGWDTETERLVVPVFNVHGDTLGVALRSLDSNKRPKTLTHTEQGAISWFVNNTQQGVIIVEDQFSAIRCSDYMNSVALLGTHLNDERMQEVRESGLRPVLLALDFDYWQGTIRYAIKYRLKPIKLGKDLKDLSDTQLKEFFNGITATRS